MNKCRYQKKTNVEREVKMKILADCDIINNIDI